MDPLLDEVAVEEAGRILACTGDDVPAIMGRERWVADRPLTRGAVEEVALTSCQTGQRQFLGFPASQRLDGSPSGVAQQPGEVSWVAREDACGLIYRDRVGRHVHPRRVLGWLLEELKSLT